MRSEEHAKQLMKTVCGVKIRKLAKYEKEWRRKMEEERQAVDPATRFERENKKLIADNMRSGIRFSAGSLLGILTDLGAESQYR